MLSRRIVLAAVAAGAAAAVAGAIPAYAAVTVTVTAGTAPSGTSVALRDTSSAAVQFKDITTNVPFNCSSASLTGTTKAGPNPVTNFAQIRGGILSSCTVLGLPVTISVGTSTWMFAVTGAATSAGIPINITGINLLFDASSCSFNVSGAAAGTWVNGTSPANPSKITIPASTATTSKLVVSNIVLKGSATQCLGGAVTNTSPGNRFSLPGSYNVAATTPAYNSVTIG